MYRLLPLLFSLAVLVFVSLRQRNRVKAQQKVLDSLQAGTEVMTTSGFYGRVVRLDGDIAVLELAENLQVRIAKGALGRVMDSPANPAKPSVSSETSSPTLPSPSGDPAL